MLMTMTPTREQLIQLVELAGKHARQVLVDLQMSMMPTWLYIDRQGSAHVCGTPWENPGEKKEMIREVQMMMHRDGAICYSLATEAWAAFAPKGWDPDKDPPILAGDQPDRREVVIAFAVDRENNSEWRRWAMRRDGIGMVTALDEESFMDAEKIHSWMTQLLKKAQ